MPWKERMADGVCICGAKEKYLVGQKKSSLLHPRFFYGSGTLIGINFDPQTAENTGPPFLAILDVENCIFRKNFANGGGGHLVFIPLFFSKT